MNLLSLCGDAGAACCCLGDAFPTLAPLTQPAPSALVTQGSCESMALLFRNSKEVCCPSCSAWTSRSRW